MNAEYPGQWLRQMGESPITPEGKLTTAGHKWSEVAAKATDSEGNAAREALSAAIVNLRQRANKTFLPTLGEFEEYVLDARKLYRAKQKEKQQAKEREGQLMIEGKPPTTEQLAAEELKTMRVQLLIAYMCSKLYGFRPARRAALKAYLDADPQKEAWSHHIRHCKKELDRKSGGRCKDTIDWVENK